MEDIYDHIDKNGEIRKIFKCDGWSFWNGTLNGIFIDNMIYFSVFLREDTRRYLFLKGIEEIEIPQIAGETFMIYNIKQLDDILYMFNNLMGYEMEYIDRDSIKEFFEV